MLDCFERTSVEETRVTALGALVTLDQHDSQLQQLLLTQRSLALRVFNTAIAAAQNHHNVHVRELAIVVASTSLPALLTDSLPADALHDCGPSVVAKRWTDVVWDAVLDPSRFELAPMATALAHGGHALLRSALGPDGSSLLPLSTTLQFARLVLFFLRHDSADLRSSACRAVHACVVDPTLSSSPLRPDDAIFSLLRHIAYGPLSSIAGNRIAIQSWLEEIGAHASSCVRVRGDIPRTASWPADLCGGRDYLLFINLVSHFLVILDATWAAARTRSALCVLTEGVAGLQRGTLDAFSLRTRLTSSSLSPALLFYTRLARACTTAQELTPSSESPLLLPTAALELLAFDTC